MHNINNSIYKNWRLKLNAFIQLFKKYGFAITLCIITLTIINLIFDTVCLSTIFLGIPCPACGITRATKLMLMGQFSKSFKMHPLLILVILGVILWQIMINFLHNSRLYMNIYVIICIVIFICFYIYRMQVYFPNVEPLIYREDNLLANFLGLLKSLK
jgi:hypothetical protein